MQVVGKTYNHFLLLALWFDGFDGSVENFFGRLLDLLDVLRCQGVLIWVVRCCFGVLFAGILDTELLRQLDSLLLDLLDGSHEVESVLVEFVVLAIENSLEAREGVLQVDKLAFHVGEHL